MALQRPARVPRLVRINCLASYRVNEWRKWLEARVSSALVRARGMPGVARIVAARVFPEPWQRPVRDRAAAVIGAAPPDSYLGIERALEGWSATDRPHELRSRLLLIGAEHDYTPLAEKHELAARLGVESQQEFLLRLHT
jgi:3-oxoadipate enol-lactonase